MAKRKNKKHLPQAKKSNHAPPKIHRTERYEFSGPLPPPNVLQQYNDAVPDAAERILLMAEQQSQHRQSLERRVIGTGSRDSLIGLIFGLIIGLAGIAGSTICILSRQQTGGLILGGGTLASLVGVFVYGSRQRRLERESKAQL